MGLVHRFRCSQGLALFKLEHYKPLLLEPETRCPAETTFANERCYEFSDSRTKKSYWDAWLDCARKVKVILMALLNSTVSGRRTCLF